MRDIVDRLRDGVSEPLNEAADEIMRLRSNFKAITLCVERVLIDGSRAERRRALEEILTIADFSQRASQQKV